MVSYGLPILYTLALWWASTIAILFLDGLNPRTFKWSMGGATLLLGFAIWGLLETRDSVSTQSAYCAFGCGLIAWGWQLMGFYMGFITGPQKGMCPPGTRGWARFIAGARTSLYHELASVAGAVILLALSYGHDNQLGLWTYCVLWWMHQSAKLNVFFGVPNLGEEFLPAHLRYLASYMARRPMNLFFPISVSISTVLTFVWAEKAYSSEPSSFIALGWTMVATMMVMAILEHWFLVVPLDTNGLWHWGIKSDAVPAASVMTPVMADLAPLCIDYIETAALPTEGLGERAEVEPMMRLDVPQGHSLAFNGAF